MKTSPLHTIRGLVTMFVAVAAIVGALALLAPTALDLIRANVEKENRPLLGAGSLAIGAALFFSYLLYLPKRSMLALVFVAPAIAFIGLAGGFLSPIAGVVPGILLIYAAAFRQRGLSTTAEPQPASRT